MHCADRAITKENWMKFAIKEIKEIKEINEIKAMSHIASVIFPASIKRM